MSLVKKPPYGKHGLFVHSITDEKMRFLCVSLQQCYN